MRLLKRILQQQTGQALPMALILLLFGGFFVVPCLALMSTSLNANRMVDQATLGLYAADSGVEDALRQLKYTESEPPSSYNLGENVNSMNVEVVTNEVGTYTLYAGEFVTTAVHFNWLTINGNMELEDGGAYKYTITVTTTEEMPGKPTKYISKIGAKLPPNFTYMANSAASFPDNLYCGSDEQDLPWLGVDTNGDQIVEWRFPPSTYYIQKQDDTPATVTQTFYLNGSGGGGGDYAWVVMISNDIGTVGEITGALYTITATASQDGKNTAIVTAEVLRQGTSPYDIEVISWQITK